MTAATQGEQRDAGVSPGYGITCVLLGPLQCDLGYSLRVYQWSVKPNVS